MIGRDAYIVKYRKYKMVMHTNKFMNTKRLSPKRY